MTRRATATAADGLRRHTGHELGRRRHRDDERRLGRHRGRDPGARRARRRGHLLRPAVVLLRPPHPRRRGDARHAPAGAAPFLARSGGPRPAITPRTRAVLLNTPHNPTGRILDDAELDAVAEVLREASDRHGRPIYLLSDEAYRLIALDGRRAPSPAEHYERTLVLYSYGKQLLAPGAADRLPRALATNSGRGAGHASRGGPDRAVRQPLLVAERPAPAGAAGHRGPRRRHRRARAAAQPSSRRLPSSVRAEDPRGHVLRPRPQPDR